MMSCGNILNKSILFLSILLFLCAINISAQNNNRKEIRGVWLAPSQFGTEEKSATEKIQSTLDEYVSSGINTLILMVKSTSGLVYYNSSIAEKDPAYNWDFFKVFLDEARKRNMTVHPWFCVFTEGGLFGEIKKHPEWLIRSRKSEMVSIVNPAIPEVRRYEISLILELVSKYDVEWIHLDYLRFPCEPTENYYSFDSSTRAQFKEYSGEDPQLIKSVDTGNMIWNEWIIWNASKVTQFMRELKTCLAETKKNIKISAAVFPYADNAKVLIGQDWQLWAKEKLVDMLCPMLYTNYNDLFLRYSKIAAEIAENNCQICLGIGIFTAHNNAVPDGMLKQIQISKDLKTDGVIFFSGYSLKKEFLDALKTIR